MRTNQTISREPLLLAVVLLSAIVAIQVMVGYRTAASGMGIVGPTSLTAVALLVVDAVGLPDRLAARLD